MVSGQIHIEKSCASAQQGIYRLNGKQKQSFTIKELKKKISEYI